MLSLTVFAYSVVTLVIIGLVAFLFFLFEPAPVKTVERLPVTIDCTNAHSIYDIRIINQFRTAGFSGLYLVDDPVTIAATRAAVHDLVPELPISDHPVVVAVGPTRALVVDTVTGDLCDDAIAAHLTTIGIETVAQKVLDAHVRSGKASQPPPWVSAILNRKQAGQL